MASIDAGAHFSSTRGGKGTNLASEADLEQANRRVADAMRRIADLKAHIARLERDGHDASESIKLLRIFETTLELMIDYRNQLARTLPDRSVSGLSAIAATILERERPRTAGFGSPDSGLPANATEVGVEVDTFPEYVAACAHIS